MPNNLEYSVSLDVTRALRDVNRFANALQGQLVTAVNRAREAVASLERMRIRTPAELPGASRAALPARASSSSAVAVAAGAVAGRLTAPIVRPALPSPAAGAMSAGSAAVVAAREIASEARAAFAPLRLALSRLSLPSPSGGGSAGGGGGGAALTGGRSGVIDVDATVISETTKSAGTFAQLWQRAVASVRSLFNGLREQARGITAKVDTGGALQNLRALMGRLTQVREEVKKTREESEKSGGILAGVGNAARGSLAPLAALAGGYLSLSFAANQFKTAINQAADFEQMQVGFSVLLQSGAKAKAMLSDLTRFADQTPMQLPELAQAARTLLAFGDPAKSVMKDLRQLGDIAAGVQAPINEIAELFGKARSEGTLFSIDIRELTRRGIPIIGELAKQFHVSESAVRDLAETGRVKFSDLQTAIGNLTSKGGMFYGMLAAQAETFNGKLTTLRDRIGALYREFGAPLLEPLKAGVTWISDKLSDWKATAQQWGQTLSNALKGAMGIFQNGDAGSAFGAALQLGIAKAVNVLYKGAMGTVAALATGLAAAAGVLIQAISKPAVWKLIGDALNVAGYSLVAILQHGIADAIRGIPILGGSAAAVDAAAFNSDIRARNATHDVRADLKNTDVQEVARNAAAAASVTGDAFKTGFAGAGNVMDEDKPAAALAGTIQKANATNNPLPIYYDNEGNPYGAGAPFGSPDSQMPKPGTPASRPTASDLGPAWRAFIQGQLPTPEPDPGPGTINGQPAAGVLGPGRPTLPGRPGALTLPGPRSSLAQPIPNLNARAEAAVGGAYARPDPNTALTAANTKDIAATLKRLLDTVQRSDRTPAGVFT